MSCRFKHEWKLGRTKHFVGTWAVDKVFPQLWLLPNFHECFYILIVTRKNDVFYFLITYCMEKDKNHYLLWLSKLQWEMHQHFALALCFCGVIKTQLLSHTFLKWNGKISFYWALVFFFQQVIRKSSVFKRKAPSNWGYIRLVVLSRWC